jgi:tyrosyl-tRNA synthetase
MVEQDAVKIDGERVEDKNLLINKGFTGVFQVGKRKFAKIFLK